MDRYSWGSSRRQSDLFSQQTRRPGYDWEYESSIMHAETRPSREDLNNLLRIPAIDIPPRRRPATPREMSCSLLPHQQVALKWLKDQESNESKRGGLLADSMGLGKTITALALILAHKAPENAPKTTLVIAPVALLGQWKREIQDKVEPAHRLSVFIYHGQTKDTRKGLRLTDFDVVLTSYGIAASDYRDSHKAPLYQNEFHRVILDEAHFIKNPNARRSKAVAQLAARYRVCMTGTPFMNNAVEIYPLLRFLRVRPYNEWKLFVKEIQGPIRKLSDKNASKRDQAVRKLQVVFRSITLRRTKTSRLDGRPIVRLPEKHVTEVRVRLDTEQRAFYGALERKQQLRFNKYLRKSNGQLRTVYTFILVLLLRLRQACCHPHLIKSHGIPDEAELGGKEMVRLAVRLDAEIVGRLSEKIKRGGRFRCPLCEEVPETTMIIYPCGHDICAECFSAMMQVSQQVGRSATNGDGGNGQDRQQLALLGRGAGGNDEERMKRCCPHEGCKMEVHPRKVICHVFFEVAHGLGAAGEGLEGGLGPGGGPTDSDLEFVVDDDYEEEEEEEEEEDEDEGDEVDSEHDDSGSESESEVESDHEVGFTPRKSRRSTLHEALLESEDESDSDISLTPKQRGTRQVSVKGKRRAAKVRQESDEEEEEEEEDPWTRFRRRQSESWKVHVDDSDSDSSVVSIGGLFEEVAATENPGTPERESDRSADGAAEDNAAKRKRACTSSEDEETPARPAEKQVRIARQTRSNPRLDNTESRLRERRRKTRRQQIKQRKKKGKRATAAETEFLSLSQQRKKALDAYSKAARARYFESLRRDFVSSAKVDAVLDILRRIRDEHPGEKTLVFSLWTSFLDLLEIPLRNEGFWFLRYDGGMPSAERDDNVAQFQQEGGDDRRGRGQGPAGGPQILLVSLMAGSAGLNLTGASRVVMLEPFWNPFVEDQAVDRAHRLGQRRPVWVYRVLVPDSVEDRILEMQKRKRALVEAALGDKAAGGVTSLNQRELKGLFGLT